MTRSLSIALIAIAFSATLYGQQTSDRRTLANLLEGGQDSSGASGATTDSSKLSPAVKKILDEAVDEVKKNRQAFDKANEKPVADARVKLQDLAKALVDEGKAEEATAVLGQIKTLDADVMQRADTASGSRSTPPKPLLERMAGKWNRSNDPSYWVIERDGTAGCRDRTSNKPCHPDSRLRGIDEEIAEIAWPNGWKWKIRLAGNDVLAVHETGPDGKTFGDGLILTRQK